MSRDNRSYMNIQKEKQSVLQPANQLSELLDSVSSCEDIEDLDEAANFVSDAVFLINDKGGIDYVNEQACVSLGYTKEELLSKKISDIDPGDTQKNVIKFIRNNALRAQVLSISYHYRKNGRCLPVEIRSAIVERKKKRYSINIVRDISKRKELYQVLLQSEYNFLSLPEKTSDYIARWGSDGRYLYSNPVFQQTFGETAGELFGRTIEEVCPDGRYDGIKKSIMETFATGKAQSFKRTPIVLDNGETNLCDIHLTPEYDKYGSVTSVLGIGRDMTDHYRMQDEIIRREQEFRSLVENTPDTIARFDKDLRCIYANPAFSAMVEGGTALLLGKRPTEISRGSDFYMSENKLRDVFETGKTLSFELNWKIKDGSNLCSLIKLSPEFDSQGVVTSVLAVGRDISELVSYRDKIHQMAFYDSVTGLPNRDLFMDRLSQAITDAQWHVEKMCVLFLDLDHFKMVNDTMGHPAGDTLLKVVGERLKNSVRGYDTVARLGGDEFAILLPKFASGDDLGRIANNILRSVNKPYFIEDKEIFVSISVGISIYPTDSMDEHDLLKHADSAMYQAKRLGRNTFSFYSEEQTVIANQRITLEGDLRRALQVEELEVYYQPKVSLESCETIGSEALLRWKHFRKGYVSPDDFIKVAEDSGFIDEIGEWVLRQGCQAAVKWNENNGQIHKVAINLSSRQFLSGNLDSVISRILQETGCRPEWIELEITETLLLEKNKRILNQLTFFREMGITIALDDFGTGYSSLGYLADFPIDTLKIDRSFIRRLTREGKHFELVKAIISIGHSLQMTVVAEGVETEEKSILLKELGCHIGQGYFYGKAVPESEFVDVVASEEVVNG